MRCMLVSCLRAFVRCDGVRPHVDARRQHRNSGAAGINLCGATLSERASDPHPGVGGRYPRSVGRNPVAERRVPCKTVLEVNDNSGRRIPGRLTFKSKEPRLKLYAFDSSARFSCVASPFSLPLLHLFVQILGLPLSRPSHFRCSPSARLRGRRPSCRIDDPFGMMDSKLS